ncbi:OmpA family protein [Arcticibacter sp.]|uniref:OmpA family protein n=1 Tax=Arcticibacter sp. TaxID=1872630 RepID=UPI003890AD0E
MKYFLQRLSFICCLMVMCLGREGYAQLSLRSKSFKAGESAFRSYRYMDAIWHLNRVLAADSGNIAAAEMLAYSYRQTKKYDLALHGYGKLSRHQPLKAEWALYYAEALAVDQQYEKSENWYRAYMRMMPSDRRASAFSRADPGAFSKDATFWRVSLTDLNTSASEYSPVFYKEGLLFASNRLTDRPVKRVFLWDKTPFTSLYYIKNLKDIKSANDHSLGSVLGARNTGMRSNDDDTAPTSNDSRTLGQYDPSVITDSSGTGDVLNAGVQLLHGSVNSKYHEGPAAAFPDGSLIFTRNNYFKGKTRVSEDGVNKLKLYIATGNNLSVISEFPYNNDEYSVGHPALTADGNILVFASDMPGGYGGTDLYYSVRSGTQWSRPINMGKQVNTEGSEQFPSLSADGSLFFSSTGHPGLGGLDVFEVPLTNMRPIRSPVNLGAPINSSRDDFGFIRARDGKSGFFSSNRRGNDDIYSFEQASYRVILAGQVTDGRTRLPLGGSRLLLRTLDGVDTVMTNGRGEFRLEMRKETDYEITAQKLGYVSQLVFKTSIGVDKDSLIRTDMQLFKTESRQQYVISNCDSLKRVFAVENIFYDLDRDEIRPDARRALDHLASLMKRYPEMSVVTASHCDSRASEEYNRDLSLRRGTAAKNYLVAKGINGSRIKVEYYGKTRLLNRCYDGVVCSEADQQLNRRTEFDVILNGVNLTQLNCSEL